MAVINSRAVVNTLEMYGVTAIRLPSTLGTNLNQLIKSLFANNEQGFAYDPNDLSTMYQDAAGTIPVTAAGQPVGLMLDKSGALALGSELKQSALAKMTGTAPVATFNTVTGVGTVNRVDVSNQSFIVFNDTVGSKWYKVSVTNNSAVSISLRNATMAAVDSTLVVIQPNTTFSGYVYVASGFLLGIAASVGKCGFTVNSIKEIAGNHAYQTTSAARPILRQNTTTGAYYLEFDGSDDFLQTNNIDFTATDKISLFAGVVRIVNRVGMLCELSANANTEAGSFYITAPELSTGAYGFKSRGGTVSNPPPVTSSGTSANDVSVLSAFGNISGDTNTIRRNAIASAVIYDLGLGNYGNYPLYIGRRAGTSIPFNGHLYSLIGVGRLTTDNETAAIEKELAKRTGVTLS